MWSLSLTAIRVLNLPFQALRLGGLIALLSSSSLAQPPQTNNKSPLAADSLEKLASDFWEWRERYQPPEICDHV
jgi:hypothetical protein